MKDLPTFKVIYTDNPHTIGDGIIWHPDMELSVKLIPDDTRIILHNIPSDLHIRFSTQQDRNNFMKWLSTSGKQYYLRTMELNDQPIVEFTNYDYDIGMIATKVKDAVE